VLSVYSVGVTPGALDPGCSPDAAGSLTQTYTADGQPDTAAYTAGALAGVSVANTYDTLSRRTSSLLNVGGALRAATSYSYDSSSRLHTVSAGANVFTYGYVPGAPGLVAEIAAHNGVAPVMTTTKTYDHLSRLTEISSSSLNPEPRTLTSFSYTYNSADQRTRVDLADGTLFGGQRK
jgi:hypothetical protein